MNNPEKAKREINALGELHTISSPYRRLSPLSKLFLTVLYIFVTVSFGKYDIISLSVMILFPVIGYQFALISVGTGVYKMRYILPLICAVGVFNPFFDKNVIMNIGGVNITGGVISMLTLMMKGVFSLLASFLLTATTPVEEICCALRRLHCPKILVSLLMLTFRYISVMLSEVSVMTQAYALRAPGQKGIAFQAWGSFLGGLILRSHDKSQEIYESMILRGFSGEFAHSGAKGFSFISFIAAVIVSAMIISARIWSIPSLIGKLIMH